MKKLPSQPERTVEQRLQDLERLANWSEVPFRQAALQAGYQVEPTGEVQQLSKSIVGNEDLKPKEQIVNMTFRLPLSRWKKLADLSTNERSPIQALLMEALKADFKRRNLPF